MPRAPLPRSLTASSCTGKLICVEGQFRSYNRHEERKNRLVLSVFAREAGFLDGTGMEGGGETNQVFLDGYICKEPTYRKTPLGTIWSPVTSISLSETMIGM